MASIHQITRLNDIATLMDNHKHADLILRCDGREFHVHKAIFSSASRVLASACEKNFEEGLKGVIEHTEFDADTMECMIEYIYKQTYHVKPSTIAAPAREVSNVERSSPNEANEEEGMEDNTTTSELANATGEPSAAASALASTPAHISTDPTSALIVHARVYAIGGYYELPTLQQLAMEKFEETAAKQEVLGNNFIEVIKEVNAVTSPDDRALRDKLRSVAMSHLDQLVANDNFMTELAELPDAQDFAADMLRATVKHHNEKLAKLHEQMRESLQRMSIAHAETMRMRVTDLEARLAAKENDAHATRIDARQAFHAFQKAVRDLPTACNNSGCSREFSKLQFEAKGQTGESGLHSDWWIRCAKCKCRLNK